MYHFTRKGSFAAFALTASLIGTVLLGGCFHGEANPPEDPNPSTVSQPSLTGIFTEEKTLELNPGDAQAIAVLARFTDATTRDITGDSQLHVKSSRPESVSFSQGKVQVSKEAKPEEPASLTFEYFGYQTDLTVNILKAAEKTPEQDQRDTATATNVKAVTVLVNKQRSLPADYVPDDLVVPDIPFSFEGDSPKKKMRKEAAQALEQLFRQAEKDGIELAGVSGYRSYETQKAIFQYNVKTQGEEQARRVSAYPGQSEHQTGLAMDLSSKSVNYELIEQFGETKEGKWLAENAPEFGFIIRYPKGKENVTGYAYEPWHIRYVGKEIAKEIAEKNLTLEEYFENEATPVKANP